MNSCYTAAPPAFYRVFECASPSPPQGLCTCYFICLENSFSATHTPDSSSRVRSLQKRPLLRKASLGSHELKKVPLDVITSPGPSKHLPQLSFYLTVYCCLYTSLTFSNNPGCTLQTQNNARSSPPQRFLPTWAAVEPGCEYVLKALQVIQCGPSQGQEPVP